MTPKTAFTIRGFPVQDSSSSRYLRTTWMLDAQAELSLPECSVRARLIPEREARQLQEQTRARNVFSRHSWENDFYLQRVIEFSGRSVLEVILPGSPDDIAARATRAAEVLERACLLTSIVYESRRGLQNALAIREHRKDIVAFTISPGFEYLRTSSKRERAPRGLLVDGKFVKRFGRLGVRSLVSVLTSSSGITDRLEQSTTWLVESRLDPGLNAAVVKSAIALEALLGGGENEPLSSTLSERSAFLLSDDPAIRASIARLVKKFYDARSAVVHGGRRKSKALTTEVLEAADRVCFLVILTLAENAGTLGSFDEVAAWAERKKWGGAGKLKRAFRPGDLKRALKLADAA